MNVVARDLRPKKPARYNADVFERLIRLLPDAALDRLEAAVGDLQRSGRDVNLIAVTKALLSHSLSQADNALPAIPPDLLPYTDPEISGGREYGLMLHVDPHDTSAMVSVREQFINEARRVRDVMQDEDVDAAEAWRCLIRRSALDPVRRGRERISKRRSRRS